MEPNEEFLWNNRGGASAEQGRTSVVVSVPHEPPLALMGRIPPLEERLDTTWARALRETADRRLRTERWVAECVANGYQTLSVSLTIDPEIRGGVPVLKGTRLTAAQALAEIAETAAVAEFANEETVVRDMLFGLSLILHRSCAR
jgi:hypothetical protein